MNSPPTFDADLIARELLPLVRGFARGRCAVALGGSCAKGAGDAHSDVDIYLFADEVLPGAERAARVTAAIGADAGAVSWGSDDPFVQGGTDFVHGGVRVECWLRAIGHVDGAVEACVRGELRREYVGWTVMGFFNHTVLSDIDGMRILHDPDGVLARWKERVATYPDPLRDAILRRFMGEARFWPENPHYLSAIERGDVIYTAGIVQLVAHALVQVLFALNRTYFSGEKRIADALSRLDRAPRDVSHRLQMLIAPGVPMDVPALRMQGDALSALVRDVAELVG